MIAETLAERVRAYAPGNALEQENVLQEIVQQHILASLWREGAFNRLIFHGGTCLRIFFHLNRFSEDLDFITRAPEPGFTWSNTIKEIEKELREEGFEIQSGRPEKSTGAVNKVFIKVSLYPLSGQLKLPFNRDARKKLRVKLETDSNPPPGSDIETRYLNYPVTAPVTLQALKSGFGMKSNALLCRKYTKGRDWYDFTWYIAREIRPDLALLESGLQQGGKYGDVRVDRVWYFNAMEEKIRQVNWKQAKADVRRFIRPNEIAILDLWSTDYFLGHLDKLREYLPE